MKAETLTFRTPPPSLSEAFTRLRYIQVLSKHLTKRDRGKINVTWNSHVTFIVPPPVEPGFANAVDGSWQIDVTWNF